MSSTARAVERLSKAEFEQLSADQRSNHVEDTLTALRESIPHEGAATGRFIDVRLYVQEQRLVELAGDYI